MTAGINCGMSFREEACTDESLRGENSVKRGPGCWLMMNNSSRIRNQAFGQCSGFLLPSIFHDLLLGSDGLLECRRLWVEFTYKHQVPASIGNIVYRGEDGDEGGEEGWMGRTDMRRRRSVGRDWCLELPLDHLERTLRVWSSLDAIFP
jgi:hypothetical protein